MTVSRTGHAYVDLITRKQTFKIIMVPPGGGAGVCVDDQVKFPNGLVITPDGKQLIVGETTGHRYVAYDIDPSTGLLSNKRDWAVLPDDVNPNGCCLDAEG